MKSLFQMTPDVVALDLILDEVGGELLDPGTEAAIESWLAEIRGQEAAKLDGYAYLIAQRQGMAEILRAKAREFSERARIADNLARRLKEALLLYLQQTGQTKVVTADGQTVSRCKTGGRPRLELAEGVDYSTLPAEFVTVETVYKLNDAAVRAALKDNPDAVPGVRIVPPGEHVRINGRSGVSLEGGQ